MKKTLIALAALAATGATLAQSSVTIDGRMDLGMSSVETTSTDNGVVQNRSDAFSLAGAQNQSTGSRLRFRGTEDLGGGMRAGFEYEIGINPDRDVGTNAQTRLANLTLSGGFGAVRVGTFMNAFDTVRAYTTDVGATPGGNFLEEHQFIEGRSQNAIAYVSPAFSGFTFSVGVLNEDTSGYEAGMGSASLDARGLLLGLGYSQGPLAVQFAFGDVDISGRATSVGGPTTGGDTDIRDWALGVRYTLAPVVLTFVYQDGRATDTIVGPGAGSTGEEASAWQIGARFPMGAFTPFISFGDGEIENFANGVRTASSDTRSWQIGTNYNLSTRTWVYAAIGEFRTSGNDAGVASRVKEEGYSIGLVHTF